MREERLEINSTGISLAGRLTWPEKTGYPVPCVIFLHPWGAWDMDGSHDAEMSLDNKPIRLFLQLRDAIVPRGSAVLRYNSRFVSGVNGGKPQYEDRTFSGLVEDAREAVKLARNTPGIDPERIWLLGISLGTEVAVSVAETDSSLQGIILMAAIGENYRFRRYYMDVERKLQWLLEQRLVDPQAQVDLVKLRNCSVERWGWWELEQEIRDAESMTYEDVAAVLKRHYDMGLAKALYGENEEAPSIFWHEWIANEPAYMRVARFPGRVLILQGCDDNATPPREAYLLKMALDSRSNADCVMFDQLGHIFSRRKANSQRTYGPLDEQVLKVVAAYIGEHI